MSSNYIGGVMNINGARPGSAFRYDGPMMPRMIYYSLTFSSTYEAIEKFILPPPIKADINQPAQFNVTFFVNSGNRAFSGELAPYQAVLLTAPGVYADHRAVAGWEFVDSTHGDHTEMDVLLPWGSYYGMLKKLADIRCIPVNGNEFEFTATRRGVRLVTGRFRLNEELDRATVDRLNADKPGTFGVREIPNSDFTGFTDRSVVLSDASTTKILQAWRLDNLGVEFGYGAQDPLSELPITGIEGGTAMTIEVLKENQSNRRVIQTLTEV